MDARRARFAVLGSTARRSACAVVAGGLLLLFLSVLLQAGKQHRQYREAQQVLLQQGALQAAVTVRARLGNAEVLLRNLVDRVPRDPDGRWESLRSYLQQDAGFFGAVAILPAGTTAGFQLGSRSFVLTPREQEAMREGRTVLVAPRAGHGGARLYLLRALNESAPQRLVLAELREGWWTSLLGSSGRTQLTAFDAAGQVHFSTRASAPPIAGLTRSRLAGVLDGSAVDDLAWNEGGEPWVGAATPIVVNVVSSDLGLSMVALAPDRPWSAAFWSAMRTQSTFLPLLLLAAWLVHGFARRQEVALRQVRRALGGMPDRRVPVPQSKRLTSEVRQLVDACNRATEALERQNHTRRVLEEIDALLMPGGDYESVLDQVLSRVRSVTNAHNVGLTLVDPLTAHGRLFAVGESGGQPVTRVVFDSDMAATLRDSEQGLTVARFELERHSFLEPLQAGGSAFYWLWPVMAGGELAAVLAVGYAEAPSGVEGIADIGTSCAQRLGLSLASHARAQRLYHQAHFDPLTQLPNRLLFRDQLHAQLQDAAVNGRAGAVLYIDLDHFKRVNDALGHEAGDQLLANVAQRLRGSVKDQDIVARLGGDEFTVILKDMDDPAEVAAVAQRINEAMRRPMRLGGREHVARASIGIALFPADGIGMDELLHHADLAMYRAKEQGRGGAEFYSAAMNLRAPDSGLFRALSRREFSLYFQPQYRVHDGGLVGVEALLRWQQPGGALRTSAEFVPAAEESGLIVDLGGWVLEVACAQLAQWRDAGVAPPRLAINLSVHQLRDSQLVPNLRRQLDRHMLPPRALTFEISEAALTDENSQARIRELADLGAGLTLDDFGTGNTSLANLRRYPVQAVKIDRTFVGRLEDDPVSQGLASAIIAMAHSLDRIVIAEGVESAGQLDLLREQKCDLAQGFFLARPLSARDMTALLMGRRAASQPDVAPARGVGS